MIDQEVEILIVEDSLEDAELAIRALKRINSQTISASH
jgi:hypothetical protein